MNRQILNIEVEFRTLMGCAKEPVLVRTLPDTADSHYYKILDIKNEYKRLRNNECVTVIVCTIAMHGEQKNVLLLHYAEKSIWKLVI